MQSHFSQCIALMKSAENTQLLRGIQRGVERESLRITKQGTLATSPHPKALGSALTHPLITTDYAEALMEFITPVADDINITMVQLEDIHKAVYQQLGDELLWPMSMPCFVKDTKNIMIAQYGDSNTGRMKTTYRQGLTYRYGSGMQIISGIHYNFSVPEALWELLAKKNNKTADCEYISARYFGLIRNYKRISWIIPYLFGASPAICKSFLGSTDTDMEFSELGQGTLYREYGTSLRMSDLGYTNKEQSDLKIKYNSKPEYVRDLRRAVTTPSESFKTIGVKVDGKYRQLNNNVLQIENEFYSTIRPKRVALNGETPTQALERAGVEYIEVRALDVNPFSPVGITAEQMRMLDLLLMYCLLQPSPEMDWDEQVIADDNFTRAVMDGRNPRLTLLQNGFERPISDWLEEIFADLQPLAQLFDQAHGTDAYTKVVADQYRAVLNPELTLSGQVMAQLKAQNLDNGALGMLLASQYKQAFNSEFSFFSQDEFERMRDASIAAQQQREEQDQGTSFDTFLEEYFKQAACKVSEC